MDRSGRSVEWEYSVRGGRVSAPTVTEDGVYIGDDHGLLYKLDPITGEIIWEFDTGGAINGAPAVTEEFVYVGSDNEGIYAIDVTAGAERWTHSTKGTLDIGPTVGADRLYIGDTRGIVYAIDRQSGEGHWTFDTGSFLSRYPIRSSITVADDTLYFGDDQSLYAVTAASGDERWRYNANRGCASTPTVADGTVYAGGYDGQLHAINATTGAVQWQFTTGGKITAGPTVSEDTVFVGSHDQTLYAIDRSTATERWHYEVGGEIRSSPTVAEQTVYVGTTTGQLYAINVDDGTEWWQHQLSGAAGTPIVYAGTLYINDETGRVSAIDTTHQSASHDSRALYGAVSHHQQRVTEPPEGGFTPETLDPEITGGRATPIQPTRIYGLGDSPEELTNTTDETSDPSDCPVCGKIIDRKNAAFCPNCGEPIAEPVDGDAT